MAAKKKLTKGKVGKSLGTMTPKERREYNKSLRTVVQRGRFLPLVRRRIGYTGRRLTHVSVYIPQLNVKNEEKQWGSVRDHAFPIGCRTGAPILFTSIEKAIRLRNIGIMNRTTIHDSTTLEVRHTNSVRFQIKMYDPEKEEVRMFVIQANKKALKRKHLALTR